MKGLQNTFSPLMIAGVFMLLLGNSCSGPQNEAEKLHKIMVDLIRPGLKKVSPELAYLDANNQYLRMKQCSIGQSNKLGNLLCPVYQNTEVFTTQLAFSVIESGQPAFRGYLFFIHSPDSMKDFSLLKTEQQTLPVGLFQYEADCVKAQQTIADLKIKVEPCSPWGNAKTAYRIYNPETKTQETVEFGKPSK